MTFTIDLTGKRALVTGSGQGVGLGIARTLAAAGAEVAINDLVRDRADAIAEQLVADGMLAVAAAFDVTDYESVTNGINQLGGVDILVNNAGNAGGAGFGGLDPFVRTEPADWDRYLKVNLYGVMYCARAALPAMIERRWGRVITIVSDAARVGEANMAAYCAAKAGAAGFNRGIAREVARYAITVNNVALGTMRTPVSGTMWDEPDNPTAKALMQSYLVRRPGEPEDAAGLIAYLASPLASWITGQTYPVNGGYSFAM